jgi:hypothetical protein
MALRRDEVDAWLRAYVGAWKTYDPAQIEALFAEDVRYRFHPYDEPVVGRASVVASWLGEGEAEGASTRDEPDTYDAAYKTLAIDGSLAVVVGATTYLVHAGGPVDRVYDNCFFIRFDDEGRCVDFTEWFMKRPKR